MPPVKKATPTPPAKNTAEKVVPIKNFTKPRPFKVPKHLADCADMLYAKRAERLQVQRVVDALAKEEGLLREHIIANLPKSNASGISGKVATARIETKAIPQIEDQAALQAYIKKTGRFDLLQNRLSDAAVLEMWADNKKVPGVVAFTAVKVSCTKK